MVAEIYARNTPNFRTDDCMKFLYFDRNYGGVDNGKYPVIGKQFSSIFNDYTQPFIQKATSVEIKVNRPFLIPGSADKKKTILVLDPSWMIAIISAIIR